MKNGSKTTSAEDLSKYTHHKEKEVSQITVHQIGKDENDDDDEKGKGKGKDKTSKTFITYAFTHYRLDPACNVTTFYRSGIGKYPIPRPHYVIKNLDFGKQTREVDHVEGIETGYSIKHTKTDLQKIADIGLQSEGKVSYTVAVLESVFRHSTICLLVHLMSWHTLERYRSKKVMAGARRRYRSRQAETSRSR